MLNFVMLAREGNPEITIVLQSRMVTELPTISGLSHILVEAYNMQRWVAKVKQVTLI